MKIYINGQYNLKANISYRINENLPNIINKIDNFFTNH